VLAVAILGVAPTPATSEDLPEGAPLFGISMAAPWRTDTSGAWTLVIETWSGRHRGASTGTARVEVGPGADVVSGETSRTVHVSDDWKGPRDRRWLLTLRRTGDRVRIRGSLHIPGPPGPFYYESVLELGFDGDTIILRDSRTTVQEGVLDGRRFRFGGEYPVAIGDEETESPQTIEARPVLVEGDEIPCHKCGLTEATELQLVVTVGTNGAVTWVRPGARFEGVSKGPALAVAEDGVRRYHFRPARSQGRPVADYAVVRVRVVPAD